MYMADGQSICGYANIEDWKLVLKADAELVLLRSKVRILEQREQQLTVQIQALEDQLDLSARQAGFLGEENARITRELIILDKKYQDERVKPRLGSPLAWSIAGVSTAALVGILLISAVD